jgi:uncharacterized peroxidase-related enzyme
MSPFIVHTKQSAPAQSVELLVNAEKAFGFIPNLLGVFAESPAVLKAYLQLDQTLDGSSLTPVERQVAILAISRFNECHYCVAAHSVIADLQKVPAEVVEAIRTDQPIGDARLEALRTFATTTVEKRGWVSENEVTAFLEAQVLEVVLAIGFKTLSNYVNHIAGTPLDQAFVGQAWQPSQKRVASG